MVPKGDAETVQLLCRAVCLEYKGLLGVPNLAQMSRAPQMVIPEAPALIATCSQQGLVLGVQGKTALLSWH